MERINCSLLFDHVATMSIRGELFAVFPGEAECAYVRIKPCCSHGGDIPNGRVNAALSGARRFSARPG